MPRSKRGLSGAAKKSHEDKIAREQQQRQAEQERSEAQANEDPIHRDLTSLDKELSPVSNPTLDGAKLRLQRYNKSDQNDNTDELLRRFLDVLPPDGQMNLIRDILGRDDEGLMAFVAILRRSFFRPLKAAGGMTPNPSEGSTSSDSRPRSRPDQARLKKDCLRRDDNRCMVTGAYDVQEAENLPEGERESHRTAVTYCCHIVPASSGPQTTDDERFRAELNRVSLLWAFIYRYFPAVQRHLDIRNRGVINSPQNALTLIGMVHEEFGAFRLAFEHVQGNTYKMKTFKKFSTFLNSSLPENMQIEFQTSTDIELPSSELLKTHCAIATYLHASGMGDQVDDMLSEEEEDEAEPIDLVDPNFEGVVARVTDWLVTVR